jgi:hypothetical protein
MASSAFELQLLRALLAGGAIKTGSCLYETAPKGGLCAELS